MPHAAVNGQQTQFEHAGAAAVIGAVAANLTHPGTVSDAIAAPFTGLSD